MPLILRAVKGSKLTIVEMDGNLIWLAGNISGSGVIPVTGSGINASNTPITSSFFVGDGSKVTGVISSSYAATASYSRTLVANVTSPSAGELRFLNSANSTIASITDLTSSLAISALTASVARFVTASNVYGPYGSNSVISASYASGAMSSSYALTASYISSLRAGGSNTQIQFNNGGVLGGDSFFIYNLSLYSVQQGSSTLASGVWSHAEGANSVAYGVSSHAEGYNTSASGTYSHAEGVGVRALGDYSHAEGYYTVAEGQEAHSEGIYTSASSYAAHAEGNSTKALGYASHTEGTLTVALGDSSHAEGYQTVAVANYSHAGGWGTVASGAFQTTVGWYNTHGDTTSYFIVGGGSGDLTRKDAFKVTNNSTIIVATQSSAPGYTGKEGEMVPVKNGASYFIYVYIGGAWRSSSLV